MPDPRPHQYGSQLPHRPIIDANACPRCGAQPGELCTVLDGRGEPMRTEAVIHGERAELQKPPHP